jgi:mannose-1-phosphate guanylyltransferase
VGAGSHIEDAVLLDGVSVGSSTRIRSSIIGPSVQIGDHCVLEAGVVVGEGVKLGAGNVLSAGARIFPGVELPEGAIRF